MIEALQAERPHREMHRMIPTIYQVADLFCGAGGSSTGAEKAIEEIGGKMELVAVNHWPIAVQTHQLNHPTAQHYLQDLDKADPEEIVPNRCLDLLMASPECRFYSRARGGKPIHDQGRMNPWIVHRWLTSLNVRCLLVENVPEFTDWGPLLDDDRPDKTKKGIYFEEWVKSLWGLGYQAKWRMLNAANYGDATTRIRFFLQARNDGKPIRWPEATHSKTGSPEPAPRASQVACGTRNHRLVQPRPLPPGRPEVPQEAAHREDQAPHRQGPGALRRPPGAPLHTPAEPPPGQLRGNPG